MKIHKVENSVEFDPDLYRGTARDYDRFRVPYPPRMLGDLLGWACGTGQIGSTLRCQGRSASARAQVAVLQAIATHGHVAPIALLIA